VHGAGRSASGIELCTESWARNGAQLSSFDFHGVGTEGSCGCGGCGGEYQDGGATGPGFRRDRIAIGAEGTGSGDGLGEDPAGGGCEAECFEAALVQSGQFES